MAWTHDKYGSSLRVRGSSLGDVESLRLADSSGTTESATTGHSGQPRLAASDLAHAASSFSVGIGMFFDLFAL